MKANLLFSHLLPFLHVFASTGPFLHPRAALNNADTWWENLQARVGDDLRANHIEIMASSVGGIGRRADACQVLYRRSDDPQEILLSLPLRGIAIVACGGVHEAITYLNLVPPETKCVLYLTPGVYRLHYQALPRILRSVHLLGSPSEVNSTSSSSSSSRMERHDPSQDTSFNPHQNPRDFKGVHFPLSTVLHGDGRFRLLRIAANDSGGGGGGNKAQAGITIEIENIAFVEGFAPIGGALLVENRPLESGKSTRSSDTLKSSSFSTFPMTQSLAGLVITLENCDFRRNAAMFGGALYMGSGRATLTASSFINNVAARCGGALYAVEGKAKLSADITVFHHNKDRCRSGVRGTMVPHTTTVPEDASGLGTAGDKVQGSIHAVASARTSSSPSVSSSSALSKYPPLELPPLQLNAMNVAEQHLARARMEQMQQQRHQDVSGAVATGQAVNLHHDVMSPSKQHSRVPASPKFQETEDGATWELAVTGTDEDPFDEANIAGEDRHVGSKEKRSEHDGIVERDESLAAQRIDPKWRQSLRQMLQEDVDQVQRYPESAKHGEEKQSNRIPNRMATDIDSSPHHPDINTNRQTDTAQTTDLQPSLSTKTAPSSSSSIDKNVDTSPSSPTMVRLRRLQEEHRARKAEANERRIRAQKRLMEGTGFKDTGSSTGNDDDLGSDTQPFRSSGGDGSNIRKDPVEAIEAAKMRLKKRLEREAILEERQEKARAADDAMRDRLEQLEQARQQQQRQQHQHFTAQKERQNNPAAAEKLARARRREEHREKIEQQLKQQRGVNRPQDREASRKQQQQKKRQEKRRAEMPSEMFEGRAYRQRRRQEMMEKQANKEERN